jgi:hypothetical protein
MYSSSSSDAMENQITIALSGGMEETISMLAAGQAGSSSIPRSKRHRCFVNHDRENDLFEEDTLSK